MDRLPSTDDRRMTLAPGLSRGLAKSSRGWDWAGIVASTICMVHCLATPVVLVALPAVGGEWMEHPLVHQLLAISVVVFVSAAIAPAYFAHRRNGVAICAGAGLAAVMYAAFVCGPSCCSPSEAASGARLAGLGSGNWWSLFGGGLLIAAHLLNARAGCCRGVNHPGEASRLDACV